MALCEKGGQIFFDSQLVSHISQGENDKAQSFLTGIENPQNLRNSSGRTLLHIAARYGNAAMTKHFVDTGFEIDARNNFNITPLALAVQYSHVETIAILLEARADVYDSSHRDCLLQTVHNSYMSRRQPVKLHEQIWKMFTQAVFADFRDNKLETGTKLWNAKCSLHLVVMILRSPKLARFYVKNGYDVNTPEPHTQCTALHAAVGGTDFPVVKVLVENGADVNALDRVKQTPLCYYNYHKRDSSTKLEMLEYLIERGASLTLANDVNCTPLEFLLTRGYVKTVDAVLRQDVDLTARYRCGRTPLHFLASNNCPGVMTTLKGRTFDVDVREENGNTPLMAAVLKNRNFSSVEFLVDNGADVNAENNSHTSLCCAVSHFRTGKLSGKSSRVATEVCKLLLRRGANVQHVFKTFKKKKVVDDQTTVFDWIAKSEQFEVSKLFVGQLVLNDELGEPITDLVREKIEANEVLNEQFKVCKQQIEKMKVARINDSLTMFELMTGKEEDHTVHAIDFEFVSRLDEMTNDILQENNYYVEIIKKRVAGVVEKLKATKEFEESKVVSQPTCCIS